MNDQAQPQKSGIRLVGGNAAGLMGKALLVLLVLLFLTACGQGADKATPEQTPPQQSAEGNAGASKGDAGSREYSVAVTPPKGWEPLPGTGTLFRYRKGSGDFWVKQGPGEAAVESAIASYQERENIEKYTYTWGEPEDASAGGMNAKYLNYTVDTGSLKMRYDVYFIKKDSALFTAICLTMPDSDYAEVEPDYKSLLDSLVIAEK